MKQMLMLAVIVIMMLLGTVVIAQSNRLDSLQQYTVENRVAVGGGYQLTGVVWQVTGTTRGGNYQLLCVAASAQAGSGCCCTYLPMTLRNFTK